MRNEWSGSTCRQRVRGLCATGDVVASPPFVFWFSFLLLILSLDLAFIYMIAIARLHFLHVLFKS